MNWLYAAGLEGLEKGLREGGGVEWRYSGQTGTLATLADSDGVGHPVEDGRLALSGLVYKR